MNNKPVTQLPRPVCNICNLKLGAVNYKSKVDDITYIRYRPTCSSCAKQSMGHRKHKKQQCEKCGFVPQHMCQLDIHHINGIHSDNTESNLQTLCANCHRLETHLSLRKHDTK